MSTLKSKLTSKLSSSAVAKPSQNRVETLCLAAASGIQIVLELVNDAAGDTGVPGLKAGLTGLLFVIDVVKKTHSNVKDVEELVKRIDELLTVLEKSRNGGPLSPAMLNRIDGLATTWITTADQVRKIASQRLVTRLVRYNDDAQAISGHIQKITWSIQSFTIETLLAIEFAIDEHAHAVRDTAVRMEEKMDRGFQEVKARLDTGDGRLPHAILAPFDHKQRDSCLEGTRTDVLDEIYRWMDNEATSKGKPHIYWINGSAGTGKTTIAFTVAEACRARGILGASFFCSRDDAECSNPSLIFTTIADQLGQYCPLFGAEVARILKAKPDIGYASVPYQLEQLIVNPLRAVGDSFPDCLVVVDALDECKDNSTTSVVLSSLSRHVVGLASLKFLITSRPEQQVATAFDSSSLNPETQRLVLHEIELGVVQNDIELYLNVNLKRIGNAYRLEESWPSTEDTRELAVMSYGLFIFAATAARYIEDRNYSDPRHQLAALLMNTPTVAEDTSSPHHHLDQLYTQVLTHAFPNISPHHGGRLKLVLGTVISLRDSLSPPALERLLTLGPNAIRETLAHLHSVIIVPDHDSAVIRLLHPSFYDFMTNPTRCRNPKFVVTTMTQHTIIARACMKAMCNLKRDICDIKDPSMLNSEVHDLQERIKRCIPAHIQYACRHWAFHLANCMISDVILQLVETFCATYMLYWIEVCSLLGELRSALLALADARRALLNIGQTSSDVMMLLYDCERFTREFFPAICISTLQIYHSALLFTPKGTLLRKSYFRLLLHPFTIYNAPEDAWKSCIRTMEGHTGPVASLAISVDGNLIASTSDDMTIRLWDMVSGAHLNTFDSTVYSIAHNASLPMASYDDIVQPQDAGVVTHPSAFEPLLDVVHSLCFSPNGIRLVSGSSNGTLRLWNIVTGAHLKAFRAHSGSITTISFSPSSTRFASGSVDATIRLWNAVDGSYVNTLQGHSNRISSIAFSPNGNHLASGSEDLTIRLWHVMTGAHRILKNKASPCVFVTFSPDGAHLLSCSRDGSVRSWDVTTGANLRTFKTRSLPSQTHSRASALDSSPRFILSSTDGTRVASVYFDNTFRLWDAENGAHCVTSKITDTALVSVTLSPDGTRLAIGDSDGVIRMWDVLNDAYKKPSTPGSHLMITDIASSPDGTRIATCFHDLQVWDATTGSSIKILKGHSDLLLSVAFSSDSARIASGSSDKTIRLWNATTFVHIKTFRGHLDGIRTIAFSPDSKFIASGSDDKTIRIWDTGSGAQVGVCHGHSSPMWSIGFTSDGTHIVSASQDGAMHLWDSGFGTLVCMLTGYSCDAPTLARMLLPSQVSLPPPDAVLQQPEYVIEDEWIVSAARRRMCWIPVTFRPFQPMGMTRAKKYYIVTKDRVAIGRNDGIIVFDLRSPETQ